MAAHHGSRGGRIERVGNTLHVAFEIAAFDQELQEAADRHVGDRVQAVEDDPVPALQFALELRLQCLLARRQEGDLRTPLLVLIAAVSALMLQRAVAVGTAVTDAGWKWMRT